MLSNNILVVLIFAVQLLWFVLAKKKVNCCCVGFGEKESKLYLIKTIKLFNWSVVFFFFCFAFRYFINCISSQKIGQLQEVVILILRHFYENRLQKYVVMRRKNLNFSTLNMLNLFCLFLTISYSFVILSLQTLHVEGKFLGISFVEFHFSQLLL